LTSGHVLAGSFLAGQSTSFGFFFIDRLAAFLGLIQLAFKTRSVDMT